MYIEIGGVKHCRKVFSFSQGIFWKLGSKFLYRLVFTEWTFAQIFSSARSLQKCIYKTDQAWASGLVLQGCRFCCSRPSSECLSLEYASDSWLQFLLEAGITLAETQFLKPTSKIWMVFPAPDFGPCPASWAMNQQRRVHSCSISLPLKQNKTKQIYIYR